MNDVTDHLVSHHRPCKLTEVRIVVLCDCSISVAVGHEHAERRAMRPQPRLYVREAA